MNLQLCLIYRDLLRLDECPYYLTLLLTGLWLALIGLRSRSAAPRHYWLIYVKIYLGSFASAEWPVPICSAAGQIRRFKWTWKPSRTPTRIYFIFLVFYPCQEEKRKRKRKRKRKKVRVWIRKSWIKVVWWKRIAVVWRHRQSKHRNTKDAGILRPPIR